MDIDPESEGWLDMSNVIKVYYDAFGNIQYGLMMSRFSIDQTVALDASHARGAAGDPDSEDDVAVILGYELAAAHPDGLSDEEFSAWLYGDDV